MESTKKLEVQELYTIPEIAESIGCSTRTVMRYIANGTLKAFKMGGKWRVSKDNLEHYLNGEPQA